MNEKHSVKHSGTGPDKWQSLKAFTQARIALGRTGISIPVKETLQFKLAHAHARDAVYTQLKTDAIISSLQASKLSHFLLHSMATNRNIYLQRPDLGRRLNKASALQLSSSSPYHSTTAIVIADGLSAAAVQQHALPVLQLLIDKLNIANISFAPVCIVEQGRVAVADEIAVLLNARVSIILIGERPGLTAANSMGAYITYSPQIGLTDESRNCISNIRPEGLDYETAVEKIFYLISEALRLQLSGVALKDYTGLI
ncbi:MAG TPA: ethanolamine ammonia-lyase subunit EutC [Chitinophagaceae bacterium]|nr:ethanolamine ammonia-lyase subunit EutC [Chitinophagaceae bacterium]